MEVLLHCATEAGVCDGFTESLRLEARKHGIGYRVYPGYNSENFWKVVPGKISAGTWIQKMLQNEFEVMSANPHIATTEVIIERP
jgi:hypothetical protein